MKVNRIATLTVSKVVVEETPLLIGNVPGANTLGDVIDDYISNAVANKTVLQQITVAFTPEQWADMVTINTPYPMPTTNSVPVVAPNASSLPTTNKATVKKASETYLFDLASHEYYGPFYSAMAAETYAKKKPLPSYQILNGYDVSIADKSTAISPNKYPV